MRNPAIISCIKLAFAIAVIAMSACRDTGPGGASDAGDTDLTQPDLRDCTQGCDASDTRNQPNASNGPDRSNPDGSNPGGSDASGPDGSPDSGAPVRGVAIVNGVLFVDEAPFVIQGVAWNPIPVGGVHPDDLDFAGYVAQDGDLMSAAGLNAVRTYEPITDRAVLDALYARGIYVLNTVYAWGGSEAEVARSRVAAVADHPAILMWLVGNEWNYNGMYVGLSHAASLERVRDVARIIREVDTTHPIATIYGELPSVATIEALPEIDVWGINAYRGISFYDLFTTWSSRSNKPMFFGEFGADAWNANIAMEDQASQADAVVALVGEIGANRADLGRGPCIGGALFEWADEWWKDGAGSPNTHDVGGVAPGGGPHPDGTFNEEWWGLVDIARTPRSAYLRLPPTWQ